MGSQAQEEMDENIAISYEFEDGQIGWEHTDGFLPKLKPLDPPPKQEPSQ